MDLLIATGSVPLEQRDIAPTSGTPQWATDGNPATGVPATDWPAWMFNMLLAEMINVVDKAGLDRSLTDWTQLYQAIMSLVGKGRFINQQRFIVSGTYVPTVGARMARIRGVGAGGPGGYAQPNSTNGYKSAAGGGGSGAECDLWIDVSSVSSLPVTIGAPASAIASEEQNSGGDSWFGNYLVTLGAGQGGGSGMSVSASSGTMTVGSAGGEVSVGAAANFLYPPIIKGGASGSVGTVIFGVNVPGFGASSSYGTPGQISSNGNGGAGGYWGAGGGGGGSSSATGNIGGAGCGAIFIVDEYS